MDFEDLVKMWLLMLLIGAGVLYGGILVGRDQMVDKAKVGAVVEYNGSLFRMHAEEMKR